MRAIQVAMAGVVTATTCAFLFLALAAAPAGAAEATGIWLSDKGDGAVEVKSCGPQSPQLCGYIYSILQLPNPNSPWVDGRNENVDLRTRPLCELPVLGDLNRQGMAVWGGWVYDPNVGKTYNAEVTLQDENTLAIHGYIAVKLLGRTVLWTRAPAGMPKCPTDKDKAKGKAAGPGKVSPDGTVSRR